MAAEFITFAALCQQGDHIVASSQLYGGTVTQLDVSLRRFGIETTFVPGTDPADYKAVLTENTKAIYTEIVANPSGEVADLEGSQRSPTRRVSPWSWTQPCPPPT